MQKNTNAKSSHGKGKPAPSGAFTHRIREDGEIFSGEEGRETSSDTTPLASVAGSIRMRSTDSDRSVRATPKKARDASPPPQDDLWVVIKNLSQQVAAQQAEMDALRNALALQQKATANLEKILGNMASQAASTSEVTQTALAAILARLEVKPDVPKLVERQPEFRKAGAAAWLALKRETSVPAHSAPKVELSSGLRLIYASGFPYAKPGDLRKAMQGARIRTSAVRDIRWISRQVVQLLVDADYVSAFTRIITSLDATIVKSFKAWIPRSEAADKDKLAAISSFAAKTVTTIQRSPDVKARNFFRSLLASIGGKTLEAATVEATKIRVQTPGFDISTLETVPKESLPVKKATEQEPACTSSRFTIWTWLLGLPQQFKMTVLLLQSPLSLTLKCNHHYTLHSRYTALQPSRSHTSAPILAPILGHQMEHVSKIDRRTTKYGARFRITVPEDRQQNIIQRLERQSKQTHWRIRQNYRHRRPDQPRPTTPPPPLSRQILAVNVANISNKRPAIRHIVRNTRLWAISETCITSSKFRFTVPGFDVIQHPATGPGRRGIALGIPSCFGGHEHGSAVGTMILAKVPNFTPECLWIVGSVYVGHSGATINYSRREAFASIRQALDRVVPFDNNHPVLIFGDWNTDPQRLQRIVHSWGHGLTVTQFSGSQITRLSTVHGRRHSSIDHFVCNAPARALLTSPRVDRQTAVADHFVIRTSIRAEAQGRPPAPRAPTISRHHCLEATDRIATSNYWDVLADGATDNTDTDTDIHRLASQFLESANAVADQLSLRLSPPATRSNRRLLSGTTKRAILASNTARQAFIAAATNRNPDPVQRNILRDEWSRLKAAATQLERVDGRKQWVKHADNLDRAVSDGRTDLVFSAARAMSGNSSRSAAVTPLYNSDGIVQYDPTSILRVMQCHYGSLAADTTGHSLDLQYWHDRQPIQVSPNTPTIRNSDILDQDFSWNQIAAALLQMSPRKAPGDDATIPRAWLCASIVSIDKKDGDPLNPGDKRGIALINVGLKLVCKVLQMRIERFVETNNLLSYEQAGFRKREECVGQVVSLVDIIQRRQNAGLNTHVLFIDIRKAFDTVPVGALLWKLQNMGFPRRTLAFLKALVHILICSSSGRITVIGPIPSTEGCQTGMSIVWTTVQLFINDILDGVAPITVPGLPRDTNPIRGLMYADDVAVFADSEQSLLAASTAIEQWANQWEMQFGVAKCGIISFTGHLAPRLDNPLDIRLHGQLVSRVESYKYLGVLIHSKLDHSAWLKQKRSALEHTISALHPVLANHQLTVNYRSRIFSAVVMGKAYYGLELIGGNKSHLAPLQTTINKGIRLFTGARLSTAIGPLLVETGIGSLLTRSLVSRVRLLERSVTKRTPINAICSGTDNDVFTLNVQGQLVRSQRWFWSRRTKQLYRNRYWLTPQVRPKTVKQRHSFALMETLRTCGDSASLQKYVTRQLLDTAGFFKDPSFDQSRAHGTRYLMLARMDALWTARKAIQIGILVDTHPFSVDHCILCDQQLLSTSIAHLVVECEQVTGHRIQSGLVPAIQKSRLRLLGRALDPGVENVYTWLRGGVLNGEADLDQRWLDGTVEHESMGTRHDNRALAARLADFLQVAYRQYQSTLWKYHRDRLVEVG
ncbi:hypothetical protein BASA81_017788 [Batrachochytrium salamandrivorans]|nr:hypothetical protein BASA81_017788 [Batrachochytrium salamandrivorans]